MIIKTIKYYYADCGKRYTSKKKCLGHELVCRCWKNPKFKTCITCKYGKNIKDSNGMEHEPQFLQTWRIWECTNKDFVYNLHFTSAHETASDLCINCPVYENKKQIF